MNLNQNDSSPGNVLIHQGLKVRSHVPQVTRIVSCPLRPASCCSRIQSGSASYLTLFDEHRFFVARAQMLVWYIFNYNYMILNIWWYGQHCGFNMYRNLIWDSVKCLQGKCGRYNLYISKWCHFPTAHIGSKVPHIPRPGNSFEILSGGSAWNSLVLIRKEQRFHVNSCKSQNNRCKSQNGYRAFRNKYMIAAPFTF